MLIKNDAVLVDPARDPRARRGLGENNSATFTQRRQIAVAFLDESAEMDALASANLELGFTEI
jgi:hypothetical protein